MTNAEKITRNSKSNLAIAFIHLDKERQQDMMTFYAFCRLIDDIADGELADESKHIELNHWQKAIQTQQAELSNSVQKDLISLIVKYELEPDHLLAIIEGCRTDVGTALSFASWEELSLYTYKVACCVGLVSVKIFGCKHPNVKDYAIALGHALQLTNILRDVGEDLEKEQRIYLPHNDMMRFQYSERDLIGKVYDGRFVAMMEYHTQRAEYYYQQASEIFSTLPKNDAKALRSAESMRNIYFSILQKMRKDGFQVFRKRYKLSKIKKIYHLLKK